MWTHFFPDEVRECDWRGVNLYTALEQGELAFHQVQDLIRQRAQLTPSWKGAKIGNENAAGAGKGRTTSRQDPADQLTEAISEPGRQTKFVPMSAARMRVADKAAKERKRYIEKMLARTQQYEKMQPIWQHAYASGEPEDQGPEDYAQWVAEGRPGETAVASTFVKYEQYSGPWSGWVFKTGKQGLGYYQDGIPEGDDNSTGDDPMSRLAPVTLKLEGMLTFEERIGDPLSATMQDEPSKELKKTSRKAKKEKARASKVRHDVASSLPDTVTGKDVSHKDEGLWAVDTANPNAWGGATE